ETFWIELRDALLDLGGQLSRELLEQRAHFVLLGFGELLVGPGGTEQQVTERREPIGVRGHRQAFYTPVGMPRPLRVWLDRERERLPYRESSDREDHGLLCAACGHRISDVAYRI